MTVKKENISNNNFIANLKKRASKSLKVEPVFLNSKLENEAITYLQKQSYLDFTKLESGKCLQGKIYLFIIAQSAQFKIVCTYNCKARPV